MSINSPFPQFFYFTFPSNTPNSCQLTTRNCSARPNSELLTPWPNSLLLHSPNHFPPSSSSSSSIFPSYTYTYTYTTPPPPSSLAIASLSKRCRFHFSASYGRPVVSTFFGVGVTNSLPVSLL